MKKEKIIKEFIRITDIVLFSLIALFSFIEIIMGIVEYANAVHAKSNDIVTYILLICQLVVGAITLALSILYIISGVRALLNRPMFKRFNDFYKGNLLLTSILCGYILLVNTITTIVIYGTDSSASPTYLFFFLTIILSFVLFLVILKYNSKFNFVARIAMNGCAYGLLVLSLLVYIIIIPSIVIFLFFISLLATAHIILIDYSKNYLN